MSHTVQILVATADKRDETTVSTCVGDCCRKLGLRAGEDFEILLCPNRESVTRKIAEARSAQVAILLIAEPFLSHRDEVMSIIATEVKRDPTCVIVLNQNNYRLGRQINQNQIIRGLDSNAINKLSECIRWFVREVIERGLDDYNHFALELDMLRSRALSPLFVPSNVAEERNSPVAAAVPTASYVESQWNALANTIEGRAQAMLDSAVPAKSAEASRNVGLLSVVHALLHLWVESRLFALRAKSNFDVYHNAQDVLLVRQNAEPLERIPPGFGINPDERVRVIKAVKQYSRDYQTKLKSFDKILRQRRVARRLMFGRRIGDAEQYRLWSVLFGPDRVKAEHEPGWDVHAAGAKRELAYRSRCALQHEYWQTPIRWPSAFILTVYRMVAGFGDRPGRTGGFLVGGIAFFALCQWLDDLGSGCFRAPGRITSLLGSLTYWASAVQYYIEVSVSSITNLGSVHTPCGLGHGMLLSAESIYGYFLLAVLTTLFVQSLLER